ncbi:MAG TPA: GNAT family N-acetyltransferase [Thermoanaerobaculia bacterium]|nr:GNAT family N-acetyltransferase [Thermoanaerobaculia bacterium]
METARLRLRRLHTRDASFILRLVNDPDWLRYIGDRGVRTAADAEHYIETGPIAMYARHGFGLFAVERKDVPGPIGMCGLLRRDILPDVDIGFAFLPEFRGVGYAAESAAAVLAWAREVVGVPRVVAITAPGNLRSQALLAKIGLHFEKNIRLPGEAEDVALFGIDGKPES